MKFRWYGEGNDRIKLSDIKQILGVKGIVWALHDKYLAKCGRNTKSRKSKDNATNTAFIADCFL